MVESENMVTDAGLRLPGARAITRRTFFARSGLSLGAIALGNLLPRPGLGAAGTASPGGNPLAPRKPPFPAKAKSIIYLHMSGAPPSLDLFDWKPKLVELHLKPCPDELLKGQRFAFIKGTPLMLGSPYKFAQHGRSGAWISETLPHFTEIVDDVTFRGGNGFFSLLLYPVVFMQFWADLGSPPHLVVVGKPLVDLEAHFQAHTYVYILRTYMGSLRDVKDQQCAKVLHELCLLYTISLTLKHLHNFLEARNLFNFAKFQIISSVINYAGRIFHPDALRCVARNAD